MEGPDEYHVPVLADEVMHFLRQGPEAGEIMDGTVGGGGHAARILQDIPGSRILAVDRDPDALKEARRSLAPWSGRVRFLQARFDEAAQGAGVMGPSLRGALLDLGVSSRQIDADPRGFSFRSGDAPLDMRMEGAAAGGRTAAEILNQESEAELMRIFREFGEERRAARLAREVVKRRRTEPFERARQLLDALTVVHRRSPEAGEKARVFQALRIAVNNELEALEQALDALRDALLPGGVMVIISYHSLEDRMVKRAFREWSRRCVCPPEIPICICRGEPLGTLLTRSVVRPSKEEVEANPRSRSARLRAWRRGA
ncbi:MAG: 16S rRNA (cytosine(1402)-N(4))-methyltransferase RsmH [Gemmatimonadales bacterium]|nr:MAG: 16S rRNA (cytosine(1402)-N(4))-methyltransferase RsmH [Gemmatimonadales bacterium]